MFSMWSRRARASASAHCVRVPEDTGHVRGAPGKLLVPERWSREEVPDEMMSHHLDPGFVSQRR